MRELFEQGWFRVFVIVGTICIAWGAAQANITNLKKRMDIVEAYRFVSAVDLGVIKEKVDRNYEILKKLEKRLEGE